jgi:hypothetical protein
MPSKRTTGQHIQAPHRPAVDRVCDACGTVFKKDPSKVECGAGRYCSRTCTYIGRVGTLAERVRRYTGERIEPRGCRLWTSALNTGGYGMLTFNYERKIAHRAAWEVHEPIPANMMVLHTCDVFYAPGDTTYRRCVQTDDVGVYVLDGVEYRRRGHLWLGDTDANMLDMVLKGRSATGDRQAWSLHPDRIPRGERNSGAKLTESDVIDILNRYAISNVRQVDLAAEYGVYQTAISRIIRRQTWRHLKWPQ